MVSSCKKDAHSGGYDVSHLTHDKLDIGNLTVELRRVNSGQNTCNEYTCECKCEGEKKETQ
jgi:hypothetical protein